MHPGSRPSGALNVFLKQNGLPVLEAEKGIVTPGSDPHAWLTQTNQSGYTDTAYIRAMPDIGVRYEMDEAGSSPKQS